MSAKQQQVVANGWAEESQQPVLELHVKDNEPNMVVVHEFKAKGRAGTPLLHEQSF